MLWKYYNPKFEYERKIQGVGWPWAGHKNFAYDLVRNVKPKKIVELGTHYGTSFWSFCQAVKDGELDTELNAIDTWKGEKHSGFYGEEVFETVKQIKNEYYSKLKINLIRKTFDEALVDFEDKSVDILHIDGLHTYEAVKHDFENWFSKVKDDGIILLHDTFINRDDFGVYKFWEELKKNYVTVEFFHSFGLGIIFKNPKKYEDVIGNGKDMQMRYSSEYEERKNREINNSFQCIQEKNARIRQRDEIIKQKDIEIKQRDEILHNKNQVIQQKDAKIALMKSSKFWKLRERYLRIKAIFSKKSLEKSNKKYDYFG